MHARIAKQGVCKSCVLQRTPKIEFLFLFCAIIKKHNPIGYDDARLILFGLFINSLSHYTTGNKTANAITLGITILCLVIFAKLERRIK